MGDDASIGVPAAETTVDMNTHTDDHRPDRTTVWVANGSEWMQHTLSPGDTMEIELANGQTAALVKAPDEENSGE